MGLAGARALRSALVVDWDDLRWSAASNPMVAWGQDLREFFARNQSLQAPPRDAPGEGETDSGAHRGGETLYDTNT